MSASKRKEKIIITTNHNNKNGGYCYAETSSSLFLVKVPVSVKNHNKTTVIMFMCLNEWVYVCVFRLLGNLLTTTLTRPYAREVEHLKNKYYACAGGGEAQCLVLKK